MSAPSEPVSTERYNSAATSPLAIAAASGMVSSAVEPGRAAYFKA
jgi:hypothetical protein